ncbi:MAG: hypothetical protein JRI68_24795 [Deltaproteobacteria bacterium]|nr:hypothetical protein [Deltaproteobacteria bacterium]
MPSPTTQRRLLRSLVVLFVTTISTAGCFATPPPMRPELGSARPATVVTEAPNKSCAGEMCFPYVDVPVIAKR